MKINFLQLLLIVFSIELLGCLTPSKAQITEPKLDGIAYIVTLANLTATKDTSSEAIVLIEPDEEILIIDNTDIVFYKVRYKGYTGYLRKNYLTKTRSPKSSYLSPAYAPSTRGSTKTADCNTVQCAGTTKKGARCRNMTTNCSGRCHLH